MPSRRIPQLRHARYYVQCCAQAEKLYHDGRQEEGLVLFNQEHEQIDAAWNWLVRQPYATETDALILSHADATDLIGDLRYRLREERVPQLQVHLEVARRNEAIHAQSNALGNLGIAYKNLGELQRAITYHEQALAIDRAISNRK